MQENTISCYNLFGDFMYLIEKSINKLYQDGFTFFLNPKELNDVTNHLKKNTYYIYKPYPDCEKSILYQDEIPDIVLYEIISPIILKHSDILGTLFSLGIDEHLFGDIIIWNNHYYFYTFKYMNTYFEMELKKIKNANITLIEKDIHILCEYVPDFEEITIINSSLRIDSVIAKIIHTNRDTVKDLIKDKKIVYNYELLTNSTKNIQVNDTFSIRKFGKYKFVNIEGNTKKNNLVLKIYKYIEKNSS